MSDKLYVCSDEQSDLPKGRQGETTMRKIVIATLVVAGVGLAGATAGTAAPASNTALKQIAPSSEITKVQHWRWRSGWRHGGCHWRWRSGWRC